MSKSKEQIVEEARKILARKREILGKDSGDQEYFKHHVKRLEKIEQHKNEIGIEEYEHGSEFLPIITRRMVEKIARDNPGLSNVDASKFALTDIASMYGKSKITQTAIDTINSRTKLKDGVDMEDLMNLSSDDLGRFRDVISEYRRNIVSNFGEHSDVKRFCHDLNAVITNHNSKPIASQIIEPVEMLIDLNKQSVKHRRESTESIILPPLLLKRDKINSRESSPHSSIVSVDETVVRSYSSDSSGSFESTETRRVYFSEVLVTSSPTPPPMPAASNRSFRAQKTILKK